MFLKENFFNANRSEIDYDQSMKNDYVEIVDQINLSEKWDESMNEIFIEILERIFDNG